MEAIADQLHSLKIDPAKCEVKIVVNRVYSTSAKRYHEDPKYRKDFLGSYYVNEEDVDTLHDLYIKSLEAGDRLHLTEKHREGKSPIYIDFDFKQLSGDRLYTPEHVREVYLAIAQGASHYVQFTPEDLTCYVLEKPSPRPDKNHPYKDGFHLIFPDIVTSPTVQHLIRKNILDSNSLAEIFGDCGFKNNYSDMYDEAVIEKNNLMMYGSQKVDEPAAWTVSYLLTGQDGDEEECELEPAELVLELCVRNKFTCNPTIATATAEIEAYAAERAKKAEKPAQASLSRFAGNNAITFDRLKALIAGLAEERAAGRDSWSKCMWAIMNVSKDNGFSEFQKMKLGHQFSELSHSHYDEDGVDKFLADGVKEHTNPINLATLILYLKQDNPDVYDTLFGGVKSYDETKMEFERNHFKVMQPLCFVEVEADDQSLYYRGKREFLEAYENLYCTVKKVDKNGIEYTEKEAFVKLWFADTQIRTYKKLVFCPPPTPVPADCFNTYNGMQAEKAEADVSCGSIEPFLRHAAVLCNNVPQHTEYFLKYLAHIVQFPGKLSNVAIVLKSIVEGVGKNTFLDFFMKLVLGEELSYESANPVRDLFSRFSQRRKERLMIVINETSGKDTHAFSEQIKDMITSTTYNHEEKGIRPIKMNNYARLIFTTNNDVPVKIGQHDRRFVVFEASNELVGNAEYFRNFAQYAADPNNALAVYEYLKSLDLSTIHLENDRPKTEEYLEIQKNTIKPEYRFLGSMIEIYRKNHNSDVVAFKGLDIFIEFSKWMTQAIPLQITSTQFGRTLNTLMKLTDSVQKRRLGTGVVYEINLLNLQHWMVEKKYIDDGTGLDDVERSVPVFRPE
ncbi:hypothetical protein KFL_001340300 [Klebsormidium nitens]|uniref:SF3 helicase domain-containing protein n=1 Tax=Klebsormidium nitens TaxID=105231 RepID=A0A1Y1HWR1_KLENI|nr:hypothetical protein KFL_001340300 [Klebsormidium nitens]|eukprot:GAQ83075.1 hypothetical protein KFL_001340300 [Klebsormidium nitens]